jgi:ABC-type phosphate/phosphonate transport system substrate-binding protein
MKILRAITGGLALLTLSVAPLRAETPEGTVPKPGGTLRLSISSSLFAGMPEPLVLAVLKPFGSVVSTETGMQADLVSAGDGEVVSDYLAHKRIHLGVMEGIELAWAQQKHPELRPLMLAVNQKPYARSFLIVRKDAGFRSLDDLRGKSLARHAQNRIFSQLFLNRLCQQRGQTVEKFFSTSSECNTAEEMLDDVVDGKAPAALIEEICYEAYSRRKPTRVAQLKILVESEKFPSAVVVYREGVLPPRLLQKLQTSMGGANRSVLGQQMMTFWKMTGFVAVPRSYEASLGEIIKLYPAPVAQQEVKVTER